jgi:hypothetical protein
MSLPHWIKWNKVKGKYEINNNMDCFKQSDRVTISISVSKSKLNEIRGIVDNLLQNTVDNSKAEKFMIRLLDAIDKKR